jgi:hypothetical protein
MLVAVVITAWLWCQGCQPLRAGCMCPGQAHVRCSSRPPLAGLQLGQDAAIVKADSAASLLFGRPASVLTGVNLHK